MRYALFFLTLAAPAICQSAQPNLDVALEAAMSTITVQNCEPFFDPSGVPVVDCQRRVIILPNQQNGACIDDIITDVFIMPNGENKHGVVLNARLQEIREGSIGANSLDNIANIHVNIFIDDELNQNAALCFPRTIEISGTTFQFDIGHTLDLLQRRRTADRNSPSGGVMGAMIGGWRTNAPLRYYASSYPVALRGVDKNNESFVAFGEFIGNALFGTSQNSMASVFISSTPSNLPIILDERVEGVTNHEFYIATNAINRISVRYNSQSQPLVNCVRQTQPDRGRSITRREAYRCEFRN